MVNLDPINVHDYKRIARSAWTPAWAYFAGGADDEVTLREGRAAFERLRLVPRVLRGVGADLRTTVLGSEVRAPILVAPTGVHGFAHPEAEVATARAVSDAGSLMAVSTVSTRALEEIAAAATAPSGSSSTSTAVRAT